MAFVFVERASGRLIGSSRYYGYDAELSEIEIGWTFIVRSFGAERPTARSSG